MADTPEQIASDAAAMAATPSPEQQQQPIATPAVAPQAEPEAMINVQDPDTMEIGSIPASQLQEAQAQGFTPVSHEEVDHYIKKKKYETSGQEALSAVEGAGVGATFGLSSALEQASGLTTAEDIRNRAEINPGLHGLGEAAGLAASVAIPGAGEAGILSHAGEGAAEAAGFGMKALNPETGIAEYVASPGFVNKIGSGAVKNAVETGMVQGGDETSKMLTQDPDQSVETAAVDIGLAGILGGVLGAGFGAVNPLWQQAQGTKVGELLKAVANKAGGIEGVIPDAMESSIARSGMDIAPEIKASLSDNPYVREMASTLSQEDTTGSGIKFQKAAEEFRTNAADAMAGALGKTPEQVADLQANFSKNEAGRTIGETLAKELDEKIGPIAKQFEDKKVQYGSIDLPQDKMERVEVAPTSNNPYLANTPTYEKVNKPGTASQIIDKLGALANQESWTAAPTSDTMKLLNDTIKNVKNAKTIKELGGIISAVGDEANKITGSGGLSRAGEMIKNILKEAEADVVGHAVGSAEGEEAIAKFAEARAAYRRASLVKEDLDSVLKAKGSTSGYAKSVREMARTDAETLVRRLSSDGDAHLLEVLQKHFPETSQAIKDYKINQLLEVAGGKAKGEASINSNALLKSIQKMSPEMRNFVVQPGAAEKIEAIGSMLKQFENPRHNFSNTGRVADKLLGALPGTAMGIATLLMGHGAGAALLVGSMVKALGKDIPAATRLALLKFLGSGQPIESEGFKTMAEFIHHTIQGQNLISKATKNIFKAGVEVLPQAALPKERDRDKLDKMLKSLHTEAEPLMDVGGKTGHYLPDHASSMGQFSANAVQYLNSLRPNTDKKNPLDGKPIVTSAQKAAYNKALDIANQPLVVMNNIQKGNITAQDVTTMKTLYPKLYQSVSAKLNEQIIEMSNKDKMIPYKTRIAMSMFLGQPLDSTMTQQSIMAAQPMPPAPQQAQGGKSPGEHQKHATSALNKLPGAYMTSNQAREQSKLKED